MLRFQARASASGSSESLTPAAFDSLQLGQANAGAAAPRMAASVNAAVRIVRRMAISAGYRNRFLAGINRNRPFAHMPQFRFISLHWLHSLHVQRIARGCNEMKRKRAAGFIPAG